ncbi:hypothetical protein EPU46_27330, partial [Escherichia coli]
FLNGMLAKNIFCKLTFLLALYLKGCSTNLYKFKAGLRRKMRKQSWTRNYLASVLAGAGFRNLSLEWQRTGGE